MSSAQLAAEVVESLVRAGIRDVVASPGSRNTPLLLALHAAEARGELRLHLRLDERGAGFLALGIAKATGCPGVVLTTSGTAVGNLLPAVMEADHSAIPLLVLTADRPAALRGTGASQTTWQPGIFANFVRACVELSSSGGDWTRALQAGVAAALGGSYAAPGPVQVNLELSPPLVELAPVQPCPAAVDQDFEPESVACQPQPGDVVLLGDGEPERGRRAARAALAAGVAVLAEPSSNGRIPGAISCYDLLLRTPLADDIRRVIVVGRPTLSRPQRQLLEGRYPVLQVTPYPVRDRYPGTVEVLPGITWAGSADPAWLQRWQQADAAVRPVVDELAEQQPLNGWGLAAAVVAAGRPSENLLWGSSQLIRDADLAPIGPQPWSYANRGQAGIDGTLSTAMGLALGSARPTTVVVGDLTALHDLNALVVPALEQVPDLRIIVGNDDGGAIFSTLEQSELDPAVFARLFGLPHGQSLAATAAALGVASTTVRSRAELDTALACPIHGLELIEVPLSRAQRTEQVATLRDRITALVRAQE